MGQSLANLDVDPSAVASLADIADPDLHVTLARQAAGSVPGRTEEAKKTLDRCRQAMKHPENSNDEDRHFLAEAEKLISPSTPAPPP